MTTYRKTNPPSAEYASQSRVLRSGRREDRGISRWSVHVLRSRSRFGGVERRGWTLFLHAGGWRAELGSRS